MPPNPPSGVAPSVRLSRLRRDDYFFLATPLVNTHVHKTMQHSSSYCINLSEYGAHICDIVLFALATLVYIRYSDAIRLQMRLNLTLIVLPGIWNDIDWLYCMSRYVLYIYTGFIFTRVSNYFSLIMNSEITSLTYSHTERLHIFSSILIIVTSNSRNASKFILFSM
jgi:hypothetical protein